MDAVLPQGIVGIGGATADGQIASIRLGRQNDQVVSQLHAKYYEECFRGNLFAFGISDTALASTNAIATGLTATAKPVIGAYNPQNSSVNLVLLRATIVATTLSDSSVSTGGFMWCIGQGQAVTTGSQPYNMKTLQVGGQGKAFAVSTAMTGLAGSVVAVRGSQIPVANAIGASTAASIVYGGVEELEGSIIVPPGGIAGLFNQVSTSTIKVTVSILWAEVPI